MSQVLNSLIVADDAELQRALEEIISDNLDGYVLSFVTLSRRELADLDREPDLIFVENNRGLSPEEAQEIVKAFPRKVCVVIDGVVNHDRRALLKAGIDEVMTLSDLRSDLGRHLLEKLLAFRDLADAETRIEESEERFRGIIEHSHDIILLLDAENTVIYTSPAFGRQMGYEEWEVLGQDITDFAHEDDRGSLHEGLEALKTKGAAGTIEFQFRRSDGNWRNFEAMGTNLLRNAMVQALVLNIRDMTEQKQAEIELDRYRYHLEALVEKRTREVEAAHRQADTVIAASPDALIALDNDGYIIFISQHYRTMYPRSADRLMPGKHISEAFDVVTKELRLPSIDPRFEEMQEWWLKPKGAKEFRMQNGTWVRLQAKKMRDGSGIVISSTNITDYKRQQALLARQSEELAAALQKEKDIVEQQKTFVSMVSHEFRTPLTIIDGNAQIIENRGKSLDEEALRKRGGTIRSAVDRLVRLIETILSAHMMEIGRLEIYPAACNLEQVIRDAVADQQEISPSHSIHVDIRDIPEEMHLDEKVIRQTLSNLLANAVKYSPGKEDIEVSAFTEGSSVVIEIQDHGLGIPEQEMPRIFTKYFRASTSGGIPGSGLGLSLVKQFVELHNGSIALRSKVGVGTVVTVSLPKVVEEIQP